MTTKAPEAKEKQVMPETDAVNLLQTQLDQAHAENQALSKRNSDLAGFQSEARESRDAIAKLQGQVKEAQVARDAAVKEATIAKNAVLNTAAQVTADTTVVAHAKNLAAAVKGLLG